MIERFRRNGARAWFTLVLFCYFVLAACAGGVLGLVSSSGGVERPLSLLAQSDLSTALNLGIGVAFLLGVILVLAWLLRAAREEAGINAVHALVRDLPPGGLAGLSLEKQRRTAVKERVELMAQLSSQGQSVDTTALAEALLDREEPRVAIARYIAGALVLLGLLGTFVGLLVTISGVSTVVDALTVSSDADVEAFLIQLQAGLRGPLEGMSLAFSTSLLGLSGSLVLGVGALGLAAAQASWTGKLEELTALHLGGGQGASVTLAPPSDAGMASVERAAGLLASAWSASTAHLDRLEAAGTRMAASTEDFRDHVGKLSGQIERVELLLARLADGQLQGRETVNDVGVKLADLVGHAAALRSDLRDGREELSARLRITGDSLREGMAGSFAELSRGLSALAATPPTDAPGGSGEGQGGDTGGPPRGPQLSPPAGGEEGS